MQMTLSLWDLVTVCSASCAAVKPYVSLKSLLMFDDNIQRLGRTIWVAAAWGAFCCSHLLLS